MSLQQLKSAPGSQMPLNLQLVSFEPYKQGQYGWYTKANLSDGATTEQVLISAGNSNIQFQQPQCGLTLPFVLKSKQNGQYVNISGYWKNDAPQQPAVTQHAQQPSMPAQQPTPQQQQSPPIDPVKISIEVQCAAKITKDMLIAQMIDNDKVEATVYFWAKVIGNVKQAITTGTKLNPPRQAAPPYDQQPGFAPQVPGNGMDIPEDSIPF